MRRSPLVAILLFFAIVSVPAARSGALPMPAPSHPARVQRQPAGCSRRPCSPTHRSPPYLLPPTYHATPLERPPSTVTAAFPHSSHTQTRFRKPSVDPKTRRGAPHSAFPAVASSSS